MSRRQQIWSPSGCTYVELLENKVKRTTHRGLYLSSSSSVSTRTLPRVHLTPLHLLRMCWRRLFVFLGPNIDLKWTEWSRHFAILFPFSIVIHFRDIAAAASISAWRISRRPPFQSNKWEFGSRLFELLTLRFRLGARFLSVLSALLQGEKSDCVLVWNINADRGAQVLFGLVLCQSLFLLPVDTPPLLPVFMPKCLSGCSSWHELYPRPTQLSVLHLTAAWPIILRVDNMGKRGSNGRETPVCFGCDSSQIRVYSISQRSVFYLGSHVSVALFPHVMWFSPSREAKA